MRILAALSIGLMFIACALALPVESPTPTPTPLAFQSTNGLNAALDAWRAGRLGDKWWPWSVTCWDQNEDGRTDLLVTTHSAAGSALFRQNPDGTFRDVTASLGVTYTDLPSQMRPVLIDVDGDGRLDLVPSNESFALPIVFNRGDKLELGPKIGNLRSRFGHKIDLNGDGRIDFVQRLRSYGKTTEYEWLNTGTTLVPTKKLLSIPEALPLALKARLVALEKEDPAYVPTDEEVKAGFVKYPANGPNRYCGPDYDRSDWNGDGIPDCIVQYFGSYGYDLPHRFGAYLLGQADETLRDVTATCGIPANLIPLFPLRDLTGDGRVDVLTAFGEEAGLYVQQPDGTFKLQANKTLTEFLAVTVGSYLYGYRTIDFDQDGDEDLLVTEYRLRALEIYENLGEGNYVRTLRASHWDAEGFDVADLNGDGLLDLVTGGPLPGGTWTNGGNQSDSQVTIWLNKTLKAPQPPPDPVPEPEPEPEPDPTDPPVGGDEGEPEPVPTPSSPAAKVFIDGVEVDDIESIEIHIKRRRIEPIPDPGPLPPPPEPEPEPAPEPTPEPEPTPDPGPSASLRHPLESVDPTTPDAKAFLSWVDLHRTKPQYAYRPFHGALAYKLTADPKFADLAAKGLEGIVPAAREAVSAGAAPRIARDSFLYVGNDSEDILFTLAWCGERVIPEVRQELEDFLRQTNANVWQPATATWFGKQIKKSGWAINSPGNNYHYSFLRATALWALYSGEQDWRDFLETDKFPKLTAYYAELPEGGSREGTGYWQSHGNLFELYDIWRINTGEDLAGKSTHCLKTLDYLAHAIMPGGKFIAPIGDQARIASAPMYDYYRKIGLVSGSIYRDSPESRHAQFALSAYPKMASTFNLVDELWPVPRVAEQPVELSYAAHGAGHYFARSSWGPGATALVFQGKSIHEGHMGHSLGHFDFWGAGGWLASTNNVRSKNGLAQGSDWQNLIVLRDSSGKVIPQDRDAVLSTEVSDDGQTWRATIDMAPAYKLPGLAWRRELTYERPHKLTVRDICTPPEGIGGTWQLNVPVPPVLSDRVITAGKLQVTLQKPEVVTIEAKDWIELARRPDGSTAANGGWRVEVTGGTEYVAVLEVLP